MNHSHKNPAPGAVLNGRYRILERMHAGAMGVIFRATDQRLNRISALKGMITPDNETDRAKAEEWFEREAKILCSLRHPNVPVVTDFFTETGRLWLVMDYVEGTNLGCFPLPVREDEAKKICITALGILKYIHNQGIIHRDIKTEHFIREKESGEYFLVDFGTARFVKPAGIRTAIGTLGFASPEHYEGKADYISDLYSLGAVLHHILTGKDPRTGIPFEFEPMQKAAPHVSPHFAALVDKTLSYYPQDRFSSAGEMEDCLLNPDAGSSDGRRDATIKTTGTRRQISGTPAPQKITGRYSFRHKGLIRKVVFISPETLAVICYGGEIFSRNINTGKDEGEMGNAGFYSSLCTDADVSPDKKILAQAMDDKRIFLRNLRSRKKEAVLSGHNRSLSCVVFSSGKNLLSADTDGRLCLWDTDSWTLSGSRKPDGDAITAAAFSPDGRLFFCGNEKGLLFYGNTFALKNEEAVFKGMKLHQSAITGIFTLNNDPQILTTGKDGAVKASHIKSLYNADYSAIAEFYQEGKQILCADYHREHKMLATGLNDGSVILIKAHDLSPIRQFNDLTKPVESVAFSPDGSILCTACEDEIILYG